MLSRRLVTVSGEILKSVKNGDPVVALESTIITHGMPWPKNYESALKVEKIIRDKNVVPATIGIIGGQVHVGMSKDQIREMAEESQKHRNNFVKISRRDFPYVLSKKLSGGTTVAGTMMVAHKAGIPIFVTGGIGGVHRGAEVTMDISADLTELGRTPVAVVSAGVKSILDIEKTLEYLETQGVCVASFGFNGEFPAFFTSKSGYKAPYHVSSPLEAARMIRVNQLMQSKSGLLFGVPIPEDLSIANDKIESVIQSALKECQEKGISGKNVTPFILARLNELTDGGSLKANLGLIENNAKVGAEIALELAHIASAGSFSPPTSKLIQQDAEELSKPRPVIVGGSNFDFVVRCVESDLRFDGSTMFGQIRSCFGGVGRNIADVLACLGSNPLFISSVGSDTLGQSIIRHNEKLDKSGISVNQNPTSSYCVVLDVKGQARLGIGDMNQVITPEQVSKHIPAIRKSPLLILDANLGIETINFILEECEASKIPVFFEPTDKYKGLSVLKSPHLGALTYASPNLAELRALAGSSSPDNEHIESKSLNEVLNECLELSRAVVDTIPFLIVTLGDQGVLVVRRGLSTDPLPLKNASSLRKEKTVSAKHYPVQAFENVVSVVGAGDCLTGGFVSGLLKGFDQDLAISVGIQAARLSLANEKNVPFDLCPDKIHWEKVVSNGRILL